MKKVLFIYASPLMGSENGSSSAAATNLFKKEYIKQNSDDEIITLDLNKEEIGNKNITSQNFKTFFTDGLSSKHIDLLKNVNKVVISTAMINFNYPATLKNYLDHIMLPNQTFRYKYDGKGESEGLLNHLDVQLIMSQGASLGWYKFASYIESLEGAWKFVGANVKETIFIDGTKTSENILKKSDEQIKDYLEQITSKAKSF